MYLYKIEIILKISDIAAQTISNVTKKQKE